MKFPKWQCKKEIKSRLELLSLANQQRKEGKTDLAEFIANRGYKAVEEALRVGWEMEEAPAKLEFRNFYKKNVSPLVTRSGLLLPKISFKEILSQRLISQKPLEIF